MHPVNYATMKVLIGVCCLGLILVGTAAPVIGQDAIEAEVNEAVTEQIRTFDVTIEVQPSGIFRVTEEISYDFGDLERHGIFRHIPSISTNAEGKEFLLVIDDIKVVTEDGTPYQYQITKEDDWVKLQIGNPDYTISGEHTYIISYSVSGDIRYFYDHDELYWNATGNEWDIPIEEATVQVTLPIPESKSESNSEEPLEKPADQPLIDVRCYTGATGISDEACLIERKGSTIQVSTTESLNSDEGLTVAVAFPKSYVEVIEPQPVIGFFDTLPGKLTAIAIGIAAIGWYLIYPLWLPIQWWLHGRDPEVGRPVTAYFDPPNAPDGRPLTAAETGTLIDESVQPRDMSAMVISLAQQGYLRIEERRKKDFYVVKTEKKHGKELQDYEKKFLKQIFGKKTEVHLKGENLSKLYQDIGDILYKKLTAEGFFPENPKKIKTAYGIVIGIAGATFNLLLIVMAVIFGMNMSKKTTYGARAANKARGLRNFLKSQERQLEFQAEKQLLFEKLLPFAVAFGVEKQWAKRFQGGTIQEPEWYTGYYGSRGFTAGAFAQSLNNSSAQMGSAFNYQTSSSTGHSSGFSGGFSGGGGGGGGGGSW